METTTTSSLLRLANRRKVLFSIYEHSEISKQNLSYELTMSLPTVTQNLKELESMGLIDRNGLYESTGGRKAQIYHFIPDSRISVGVSLSEDHYRIVAANLYGQILKEESTSLSFSRSSSYFEQLGNGISEFMKKMSYQPEQILGVSIAIPGLISVDGFTVVYGKIPDCAGLTIEELQQYIPYPCTMVRDTEASSIAEVWAQKDIQNAVLLSLSKNFGGTLIINGEVHRGLEFGTSLIEHMCLYPGGNTCYCGNQGCVETYCSANALEKSAGEPLEDFFTSMRSGNPDHIGIWNTYLHDLALLINNIRMLTDCEFIIGGYVQKFMEDSDFIMLEQYIKKECPFESAGVHLRRSLFTEGSTALGAAILLIESFINSF